MIEFDGNIFYPEDVRFVSGIRTIQDHAYCFEQYFSVYLLNNASFSVSRMVNFKNESSSHRELFFEAAKDEVKKEIKELRNKIESYVSPVISK